MVIQAGASWPPSPRPICPITALYEKRQIAPASTATAREITIVARAVPFGTDILLPAEDNLTPWCMSICEIFDPHPPSSRGALAGGTILCNLSGSPVTVGALADAQSRRAIAAHLRYAAAGRGIDHRPCLGRPALSAFEYGELLGEGARFSDGLKMLLVDIDVERLVQERRRVGSFRDAKLGEALDFRQIPFRLDPRRAPCPCCGRSRASPMCPPAPRSWTRIATRPGTSRSAG